MASIDSIQVIRPSGIPDFAPAVERIAELLTPIVPSARELAILPGLCDVHVHFREPGQTYKETIATGSRAAARGGFTDVCTMPNLDPVPDTRAHLALEQEAIARDAVVRVYPYASVTRGEAGEELADIAELGSEVIGYSDDGKGVQSAELMRAAMAEIAATGKPICTHSEIAELKGAGYINDGAYAAAHGHIGVPKEAEWGQIKRDIELAAATGVKYHICHISCGESADLVRAAKARGVDITCETAPHYLLADDSMLAEDGRFKMNPPLRSPQDRAALRAALLDGTVDMIATDHAPHSAAEKAKGLAGSAFGVVGIETSFPLCYTEFVRSGLLGLERLLELMAVTPRARFGIAAPSSADVTVWDLGWHGRVDPAEFISLGKAQPFTGREVYGRCLLTLVAGRVAWAVPELGLEIGAQVLPAPDSGQPYAVNNAADAPAAINSGGDTARAGTVNQSQLGAHTQRRGGDAA